MNLKEHPVIVMASLMTAAGAVIASIYLNLDKKHDEIQTIRIKEYQEQLGKLEAFPEKYHAEQKQRRVQEVELEELKAQLGALRRKHQELVAGNWEQKYRAEHIANASLSEELTLTKQRHRADIEVLNSQQERADERIATLTSELDRARLGLESRTGDAESSMEAVLKEKDLLIRRVSELDKMLGQKRARVTELENKLQVSQLEIDRLRNLVTKLSPSPQQRSSERPQREAVLNPLIASVKAIIDSRISNGYPFSNLLCYGVCDLMAPLSSWKHEDVEP